MSDVTEGRATSDDSTGGPPPHKALDKSMLRRLAEELGLAFSLLTRFPLPRFEVRTTANLSSAFWAYPLAGAVVGLAGALVFTTISALGLSPWPATLAALTAMALATGGFHEDGLADFWDGLGGGQTREAKLEIMRDSRIGTYGFLALFLALAMSAALYVEIAKTADVAALAMIATATLARAAIAVPLFALKPARPEGLAVAAERPTVVVTAVAVISAVLVAMILMGPGLATAMILGALAGSGLTTWLSSSYLRGYTGDVLGASAATAALFGLLGAAAAVSTHL